MQSTNECYEILYVALGYDYLLMAAHSAATAKKNNPGIFCTVVTNIHFDNAAVKPQSFFDRVILIDKDSKYNRTVKTNVYEFAKAKRCLFLDCDTEVRGSLDPIFRCLDRFDMAMKLDLIHLARPRRIYDVAPGIPGELFSVWNSGVIFFSTNDRVKKLFNNWSRIFLEEGRKSDQPALARAVYETPDLKLLTLNPLWNTFPSDIKLLGRGLEDSIIWHYRHPYLWPQVAPALYRMHHYYSGAITNPSEAAHNVIKDAAKRYKFLSSTFYRLIVGHAYLKSYQPSIIKMFAKVGNLFKVNIKHEHQYTGKGYDRLDN